MIVPPAPVESPVGDSKSGVAIGSSDSVRARADAVVPADERGWLRVKDLRSGDYCSGFHLLYRRPGTEACLAISDDDGQVHLPAGRFGIRAVGEGGHTVDDEVEILANRESILWVHQRRNGRVQVIDYNQIGIAGAVISCEASRGITDGNGYADIADVDGLIWITADGYLPAIVALDVAKDSRVTRVMLEPDSLPRLRLVCVDDRQLPLAGVRVAGRWQQGGFVPGAPALADFGTTDARGFVSVPAAMRSASEWHFEGVVCRVVAVVQPLADAVQERRFVLPRAVLMRFEVADRDPSHPLQWWIDSPAGPDGLHFSIAEPMVGSNPDQYLLALPSGRTVGVHCGNGPWRSWRGDVQVSEMAPTVAMSLASSHPSRQARLVMADPGIKIHRVEVSALDRGWMQVRMPVDHADGRSLVQLPTFPCKVTAVDQLGRRADVSVDAGVGDFDLGLHFPAAAAIQIAVEDRQGRPISDVVVVLRHTRPRDENGYAGVEVRRLRLNADGVATATVSEGEQRLECESLPGRTSFPSGSFAEPERIVVGGASSVPQLIRLVTDRPRRFTIRVRRGGVETAGVFNLRNAATGQLMLFQRRIEFWAGRGDVHWQVLDSAGQELGSLQAPLLDEPWDGAIDLVR